jgi:hypothetical protein
MGKVNKANLCNIPEIAALVALSRFYSQMINDIMTVLPLKSSGYANYFRDKWTWDVIRSARSNTQERMSKNNHKISFYIIAHYYNQRHFGY